jgi:hypothetical protein
MMTILPESEYIQLLNLEAYTFVPGHSMRWDSRMHEEPGYLGLHLVDKGGDTHFLYVKISVAYQLKKSGLQFHALSEFGHCRRIGNEGVFLISNSPWLEAIKALPMDQWQDWTDDRWHVTKNFVSHMVVVVGDIQIDVLTTSALWNDSELLPIE